MRSTLSLRTVSQALPLKQFYFGILRGGPFSVFVHQSCIFVHQACTFVYQACTFVHQSCTFVYQACTFVHQSCAFVPSRAQVGCFFFVTQMSLLTCLERLWYFRVNENTSNNPLCSEVSVFCYWRILGGHKHIRKRIRIFFPSVVCLLFMADYDFSLHNQTNNYTIHVAANLAAE